MTSFYVWLYQCRLRQLLLVKCVIAFLALWIVTPSPISAQEVFSGAELVQSFDSLAVNASSSPGIFTFIDNATIKGWYSTSGSTANNGRSSSGAQTTSGDMYSWGSIGQTERALGSFSANGFASPFYFGVQIVNNSGQVVDHVEISTVIEQWRRNINATEWSMEYLVATSTSGQLYAAGYTTVTGWNILSPKLGGAGGLNGNDVENQISRSVVLYDVKWAPGTFLWIRWKNAQGTNSCGLGLDQFRIKPASGIERICSNGVSLNHPTVQSAVDASEAGDRIILHTGIYHENIVINGKNAPVNNPIILESKAGAEVIMDGADPVLQAPGTMRWSLAADGVSWTTQVPWSGLASRSTLTWASRLDERLIATHHDLTTFQAAPRGDAFYRNGQTVWLKLSDGSDPNSLGLNIGQAEAVIQFVNSSGWVLRGITLRHGGYAGLHLNGSGVHDIVVDGVTVQTAFKGITTETYPNYSSRIQLKHCRVINYWDFNWEWKQGYSDCLSASSDEAAPMRGTGIRLFGNDNQVTLCEVAGQWDGMGIQGNNVEISQNLIHHTADDMVELESGNSSNVYFHDNLGFNLFSGISLVSNVPGPIYIYRNRVQSRNLRLIDQETGQKQYGYALKFGTDWGWSARNIYIYHNTFDTASRSMFVSSCSNYSLWSSIEWVNNIFSRDGGAIGIEYMGAPERGNLWLGNLFSKQAEIDRLELIFLQQDPGWQSSSICLQGVASVPPELGISTASAAYNAASERPVQLNWPDSVIPADGRADVGACEIGVPPPEVGAGVEPYLPW